MLVATYAERPDLAERTGEIEDVWPEFMHHGEVTTRYWPALRREIPELQLVLYDEEADAVVGRGQTVPTSWDGTVEGLPEGVDDVLERWFEGRVPRPTTLSVLVAVVDPRRQGEGLSYRIIEGMRELARRNGLDALIAPVRPTLKARYVVEGALVPVEIDREADAGRYVEPNVWMRHAV